MKRLHHAAARFYEQAFAADPKLATKRDALHRYYAACAAALCGCGEGKEAVKLSDMERAGLRRQALAWLTCRPGGVESPPGEGAGQGPRGNSQAIATLAGGPRFHRHA